MTNTGTSFEDYLVQVVDYRMEHPELRPGQAAYNVLGRLRPELANQVRTMDLDPFYGGAAVLDEFYEWVGERW